MFESLPDPDVTGWHLRICETRVHDVGKALPCIGGKTHRANFAKSDDDIREFNDLATVDIGRTCPVGIPDAAAADNKFKVTLIYEAPTQTGMATNGMSIVRIRLQ